MPLMEPGPWWGGGADTASVSYLDTEKKDINLETKRNKAESIKASPGSCFFLFFCIVYAQVPRMLVSWAIAVRQPVVQDYT